MEKPRTMSSLRDLMRPRAQKKNAASGSANAAMTDTISITHLSNVGAHRPPSPDLSKFQNSKVPVPSANGGSVQRSGSAIQGSSLKNLQRRPTRADGRPAHDARKCTHETLKTHEKKSARIREIRVKRICVHLRPSACICGEKILRSTQPVLAAERLS